MKRLLLCLLLTGCLDVVYHPPQPSPTPSETPTPVEAQSPAPFETPSPAPTTPPPSCILPPGGMGGETCILNPKTPPSFLEDLHEAQRLAANNGFVKDGQVLSEEAYGLEIERILKNMGLCAKADHDEVLIKVSNEESQHYDILTSWGATWDGYVALCRPSKF